MMLNKSACTLNFVRKKQKKTATKTYQLIQIAFTNQQIVHGGLVVSVLATGPKVCGFKIGQG
jgi:hypothetical protein